MSKFLDAVRDLLWSLWGDLPADTDEVIEEMMAPAPPDQDQEAMQEYVTSFFMVVAVVLLVVAGLLYLE